MTSNSMTSLNTGFKPLSAKKKGNFNFLGIKAPSLGQRFKPPIMNTLWLTFKMTDTII